MGDPQRLKRDFGEIEVAAFATGDPDDRGMVVIRICDIDGTARSYISTELARVIGEYLVEVAAQAERFSTHGFVGSDE